MMSILFKLSAFLWKVNKQTKIVDSNKPYNCQPITCPPTENGSLLSIFQNQANQY